MHGSAPAPSWPGLLWWWNTTDLLSGKKAGQAATSPALLVSSTTVTALEKTPVVTSKLITVTLGPMPELKATSVPSGENAGVYGLAGSPMGCMGERVPAGSVRSLPPRVSVCEPSGKMAE